MAALFTTAYVPAPAMEALQQYRYSAVDHSLVSKYILQPYWSRLVTIFPLWMAYAVDAPPTAHAAPTVAHARRRPHRTRG